METKASPSIRDLYQTLKTFHDRGKDIPAIALPELMKVVLSIETLAKETEEELDIATRLLNSHKPPADPMGNVLRMPARPRVVASPSDGGDAA